MMNNCRYEATRRLTFSVDGSQVSIFKERDKVSLGGFLQSHDSGRLETEIGLGSDEVSTSHKAKMSNDGL